MAFKAATTNTNRNTKSNREPSEFDGLWINVGVVQQDEESGALEFNRLPRGIPVADLVEHTIYASSNPDWAASARFTNTLIRKIREQGLKLEAGEAIPINLSVQLYRNQDQISEVNARGDKEDEAAIDSLFGA